MKAIFSTPWKRTSAPGYVPAPLNPYQVAVVTTTLQALLSKATVLVHTLDLSPEVVVELKDAGATVELPEDTHREIQALVDALVLSHELCVFVPVSGIAPPVAYQTKLLPYISAGPDVAWHMLPGTSQPALFADLRGSVDFTLDADAIHDAVVAALTHQYVLEQGQGVVGTTPVRMRASQDTSEALATLKMHLWAYPDTVDGLYLSENQTVMWTWAGTVEPYSGPARSGVDVGAVASLASIPDGFVPLGTGNIGDDVQRALGDVLELRTWRDVALVSGPQASVCILLARSLTEK
jgi:hypothetical protein